MNRSAKPSAALLFGLGMALRQKAKPLPPEGETPLKTKIEQLLTEARVIIRAVRRCSAFSSWRR